MSKNISGGKFINALEVETDRLVVDSTQAEALVVRKNNDGEDVLVVNTLDGKMTLTGDLNITGNLTYGSQNVFVSEDNIIKLANGNASDTVDIGFYGQYNSSGTKYSGVVRDASDGIWKFFKDITTEPTNTINFGSDPYADLRVAGLTASTLTGTISTAAQPNITSLGTLSSLSVSGNISCTGNVSGTLSTAAQPNITSLGTLSSLSSSGNIYTTGSVMAGTSSISSPWKARGYSASAGATWSGGAYFGGDNMNIVMGEYNSKAELGAHNGAMNAWADLYLNSGGKVSIGTTSAPGSSKLRVGGQAQIDGTLYMGGTIDMNTNSIVNIGLCEIEGVLYMANAINCQNNNIVNCNLLYMTGDIPMNNNNVTGANYVQTKDVQVRNASSGLNIGQADNHAHIGGTNSAGSAWNDLYLNSYGGFGVSIGTTTPPVGLKLLVGGDTQITGTLYASSHVHVYGDLVTYQNIWLGNDMNCQGHDIWGAGTVEGARVVAGTWGIASPHKFRCYSASNGANWTGSGYFGSDACEVLIGEYDGRAQIQGKTSDVVTNTNLYLNPLGSGVSIGTTTSPGSNKLLVGGDSKISGNLEVTGTLTASFTNGSFSATIDYTSGNTVTVYYQKTGNVVTIYVKAFSFTLTTDQQCSFPMSSLPSNCRTHDDISLPHMFVYPLGTPYYPSPSVFSNSSNYITIYKSAIGFFTAGVTYSVGTFSFSFIRY